MRELAGTSSRHSVDLRSETALSHLMKVSSTPQTGRWARQPAGRLDDRNVPDTVRSTVEVDGQQPLRTCRPRAQVDQQQRVET